MTTGIEYAEWAAEVEGGLHNAHYFPSQEVREELASLLGRTFSHRIYLREEMADLFRQAAAVTE